MDATEKREYLEELILDFENAVIACQKLKMASPSEAQLILDAEHHVDRVYCSIMDLFDKIMDED